MKEFNKILYDILLKLDLRKEDNDQFMINSILIQDYFSSLKKEEKTKLTIFNDYFINFFNFCFELPLNNMLEGSIKFKF